ncbi:MAG: hypothetical protein HOI23_18470 [Deltaproteobacteria bacterium]|nr:hypothetical protein [Deltaproteobacteria bacterium]
MTNQMQSSPNALGFILVGEGYISRSDLYTGLREHEHAQEPLGQSLVKLGLLEAEHLTDALALQAHCTRLPSGEIQKLLKQTQAERCEHWEQVEGLADVLVFGEYKAILYMAVTDARALRVLDEVKVVDEFDFAVFVVSEQDYVKSKAILAGEEPVPEEHTERLGHQSNEDISGDEQAAQAQGHLGESNASDLSQAVDQGTDSDVLEAAGPVVLGYNMQEIGYYEASEALFEAPDLEGLGGIAASALQHFFTYSACLTLRAGIGSLLAKSSVGELPDISLDAPIKVEEPYYGPIADLEAGSTLADWLAFGHSPAILVAYWPFGGGNLVLVGAHGPQDEPYGDLNDVSGLFRDVETALNVLNNDATNG